MNTTPFFKYPVYCLILIFSLSIFSCSDDTPSKSVKVKVVFKGVNDTFPVFNPIGYKLVEYKSGSVRSRAEIANPYSSSSGVMSFTEDLKIPSEYSYYLEPAGYTFDFYMDAGNMVIPVNKEGTDTTIWLERCGRVNILLHNTAPVNAADKLEISPQTNGKLNIPGYGKYLGGNYFFTGTAINQTVDCKISPNQSFIFEYFVTKDTLGTPVRKRYFMQFPMHKGRNPDLEILY